MIFTYVSKISLKSVDVYFVFVMYSQLYKFCSCFYGFQIRFQNCFEGVVLFLFAFYYSIYFQQALIAVGKQDDCDKRLHLFMSSLMFNIAYSYIILLPFKPLIKYIWKWLQTWSIRAIVVVIVCSLHLQLPMQSENITTSGASSDPVHGEVHIMWYFVSNFRQVDCFLGLLRILPPIALTSTINLKYYWKWS